MNQIKFAAAINCMDGRAQLPVISYLKEHHGIDHVDMITEPGPECILAGGGDPMATGSIRKRVEISVGKHGSKLVAVAGHHDCAGNPVSKDEHIAQIKGSCGTVEGWGLGVKVIGLWVDESWNAVQVFPSS